MGQKIERLKSLAEHRYVSRFFNDGYPLILSVIFLVTIFTGKDASYYLWLIGALTFGSYAGNWLLERRQRASTAVRQATADLMSDCVDRYLAASKENQAKSAMWGDGLIKSIDAAIDRGGMHRGDDHGEEWKR